MAKQWHQLERLDHRALKKLQQEREKQAQLAKQEAERKRYYIIGFAIAFAIVSALVFLQVIRKRAERKAFLEERKSMMISEVKEIKGTVLHRSLGDWIPLTNSGFKFDTEYSFKTEKDSLVSVELQLKNLLKLASNSEMVVYPPKLEENENKIIEEKAKLVRGELTVFIDADGRDVVVIECGRIVIMGASGLFKVIYSDAKDAGEVVVKNGLVEVYALENPSKKVKVSGFYKVVFKNGQLNPPSQASIIQYDWR